MTKKMIIVTDQQMPPILASVTVISIHGRISPHFFLPPSSPSSSPSFPSSFFLSSSSRFAPPPPLGFRERCYLLRPARERGQLWNKNYWHNGGNIYIYIYVIFFIYIYFLLFLPSHPSLSLLFYSFLFFFLLVLLLPFCNLCISYFSLILPQSLIPPSLPLFLIFFYSLYPSLLFRET